MDINIKKEAFVRGLAGFPIGVMIGCILSIVFSFKYADGSFHAVLPGLTEKMGNELNAVILQTILCGVIGSAFSAGSVIWEIDSWSIARQSAVYFLVGGLTLLPIAYLTHWMEHSVRGAIIYFILFVFIFAVIWIAKYLILRSKIKRINGEFKK